MAKLASYLFIPVAILFLFFSSCLAATKTNRFSRDLSPESLNLHKEKLTHLHFYFHDIFKGPNATSVTVARALTAQNSSGNFGDVVVMDAPLTVGPEPSSKAVGKAQVLFAAASKEDSGLLMVMYFAFTEGKYNGSSISVLGRNRVLDDVVREMPIVGGSGAFRFARGYALARTYALLPNTNIEYNVYVFHYH